MVSASGPIASTRASRKYGLGLRQTHLVRPCEVRVLRRQYADGDPPRGRRLRLLQHQLDVIQELVSVAVGAPDVAQAEQLGRRRRHSGEPAHRRPCRRSRRGCRSTRHDRQAREPPSPAGGNPRTPGPARAHRRGCPNTVASSADGAADVDHAPAAQRSTSLRVIKRIVRSLKRCERADNDPGITPGSGKPRLTGGQHASIGSDRGWASRSLNGTANTFHDQQGCGILSVRTISRTAGSATEITAACRPYPSGFDHGQPNTAHAWVGGSGERS
jgi:hypothetical protein